MGGRRLRDEGTHEAAADRRGLAPSGGPGGCEVWGVLNVTPDSFSDGGRWLDPARALERARAMRAEGADVIDVGGASSRPPGATYGAGAADVSVDEERARVVPVIEALAREGLRISVDTTRAPVAEAALAAGATIVNDVSMGSEDELLDLCARRGAELVLMHTRAGGKVDAGSTAYDDVVSDVIAELMQSVDRAVARGVGPERIWIDPGIGFAKTAAQSALVLGATARLVETGHRVLVGASRKSFVARLAPRPDGTEPPPGDRLGGSLAAVTAAVLGGAHAVRVHDVAESRQAVLVAAAMRPARAAAERGRRAHA